MTSVLNIILLALAGLCLLGALFFLVAGIRFRIVVPDSSYGVERQKARHGAFISFLRSIFLVTLALILFAILGITNLPEREISGSNRETSTPALTAPATRSGSQSTRTMTPLDQVIPPTSPVATLTSTPIPTSVPTDTPIVTIAVVDSPNGLWLREKPGGTEELELIANGFEIILLDGLETADDLEWQEVRVQSGQEGWVAVAFIIYQ